MSEKEKEEGSEYDSEGSQLDLDFDAPLPEEPLLLGTMLNDVLGNYLEYRSDNGSLNLADAVLLLRNSLEAQNELMQKQTQILAQIAQSLDSGNASTKMKPGKNKASSDANM